MEVVFGGKRHSGADEKKVEKEVGRVIRRNRGNRVFEVVLRLREDGNGTFRIILEKRVRRMPMASM